MNDILRLSKRILTVGVVVTTIAWSIGFAAFVMPLAAEAATLSAGDLIKASQPAVYYYAADGQRYVFPNENTYFSWYPDFSTVKVITDAELADVTIGGNITIRPATHLIKITTDPKVYAVTSGGELHWVETEDIAVKLWGADWASLVVDVPDSFFTNYSIGDSISDYTHPDGTLVKYEGDANVYVIDSGTKRLVTNEAAFNANNFMWDYLYTIPADVTYTDGSDITGAESGLTDLIAGASSTGTGLSVALSSTTPAGATLPQGSSANDLFEVDLTASADGAIILTSLHMHRFGVGASADWSNLYLYEGAARLTSGRSINASTNIVEFNNLNKTIAAGTTLTLTLVGDVATSRTAGAEHAFELTASTVVGTDATVSGTFPMQGNTFTIGSATGAGVTIIKGTTPANVTVGSVDADVSTFKLTASGSDLSFEQISLLQAGSVTNSDLTNLKLLYSGDPIATAATMTDDKAIFVLDTPFTILDGHTKNFTVQATIGGKSSRTIILYLEYSTDLKVIDTTYNAGATVTNTFGTTALAHTINVQGGQVSVAFNGPTTGNIKKSATDAVFYKFAMTAAEQELEVKNINFGLYGNGASDYIDVSGTDLFTDIKIIDEDTGVTLMGPTTFASAATGGGVDALNATWTLNNPFYIDAGTTRNLAFTMDVANNTYFDVGTKQYYIQLAAFAGTDIKEVDSGDWVAATSIVPNTANNGNGMTIKASSLTVGLAGSPVSDTYVRRQTEVPAVGFTFEAGSQSDVTITSLVVTGYGAVNGTASSAAQVANIVTQGILWHEEGGVQKGTAKSPDATTGAMTFTNLDWTIEAGHTETLIVKIDFDSVASTTADDQIEFGISTAAGVTAEDADSNSVTAVDTDGGAWSQPINGVVGGTWTGTYQTVKNSGTLTIASHSNPDATIIVSGDSKTGTWYEFAQAKATAQYEAMDIDMVRIIHTGTNSNGNFYKVGIQSGGAVVGEGTLVSGASTTDVLLSTPITIPKGGNATFQVVGQLNPNASGATSGNNPVLGVNYNVQTGNWTSSYANKYNIRTTGDASGALVYATASANLTGNAMVIRRTKITLAKQSLSSTSLTNGELEINKEKITADSAGDASLAKITYDVSITDAGTALSLSSFKFFRDSTELLTGSVKIYDKYGTDLRSGSLTSSSQVFVYWVSGSEEVISGSGHNYTLKATLAGVNSGDSISTTTYTNAAAVVTQKLDGSTVTNYYKPNLETNDGAYLIWSDQSATPHNATWSSTGSADWTDEYLLQSISETFVLSA